MPHIAPPRRICHLITVVLAFCVVSVVAAEAQEVYMPGEILVMLREGVARADLEAINAPYDVTIVEFVERLRVYRLSIPQTRTTTEVTGCPAGFAGTFAFDAVMTNVSGQPLRHLSSEVTVLTNGNVLRAVDEETRAVGARVPVPRDGDFADALLAPGESVQSRFFVCLKDRQPFQLFVNVLGIVDQDVNTDAP